MRFSVGVNYVPRDEAAKVREDFEHMAALGLDTVRFFVSWDDAATGLDALAATVAAASAAGLRAIPALTARAGIGDIYGGTLLERQLAFAEAAGDRIGADRAIVAWDIGHAFTSVSPPPAGSRTSGEHASEPVAERTVAAWSSALARAFRASSSLPSTAGATSDDLVHDNHVRLATLCVPLAFASMQGSNVSLEFARDRLDPETLPFLAMLTAAFSYKPVLVSGFGNPGAPYFSDGENAEYATAVLERLHVDGRLGALWSAWPGSTSPVAAALGAFARKMPEVRKPLDMPMIASTYYYRTLPDSTRTLYDAYLAFVADRR